MIDGVTVWELLLDLKGIKLSNSDREFIVQSSRTGAGLLSVDDKARVRLIARRNLKKIKDLRFSREMARKSKFVEKNGILKKKDQPTRTPGVASDCGKYGF